MPRLGRNPNTAAAANELTPVVLTCITHLPNQEEYHAKRLEIIKICLTSMRAHAHKDYSIIIWDNGSCDALRDWLRNEYKPTILIESVNIGKTSARLNMARMLQPDTLMSYADDDMYFYDNWLIPQIELIKYFPSVSCVTGYPVRTQFRWGCQKTIERMSRCGKIQTGRLMPEQWERDFAVSIGRDPEVHLKEYAATDIDYMAEYNGRYAYLTSHHCQFIATAGNIVRATVKDTLAMAAEHPFDTAMDALGNRLATVTRLVRHMGNVLDDKLMAEIKI